MACEAVHNVFLQEKKASDKISEAREKAKVLSAEAERKGTECLSEAKALSAKKREEMMLEAEKEAEKEREKILHEVSKEKEKLKNLAEGQMENAAKLIVERIVRG